MATPKWDKGRKLWIIQAKHNGIRKAFYSSVPGREGQREVTDKYNAWMDYGGVKGISVERCVQLYLEDIRERIGKKTTYTRVESYSRLYILPALGRSRMDKLTILEWQRVINNARPQSRRVKSLSYKTLCNLREVIVGLHNFAYKNYYCDAWRGTIYIPQGHEKGERAILQPADIQRLFEPSDIWYHSAFCVMLLCGLRPGEALAIKTTDIKNGTLMIRRSINSQGVITEGKNKNARRTVPLPPLAEGIIKATIARNEANHFNTPWVFCNGSGAAACPSVAYKQWLRLKAERNLPGSLYSLRHTFVSIVSSQTHLADGTIRQLVGHSQNMDTYGTYKHQVDGELEQAAQVISLTFERLASET